VHSGATAFAEAGVKPADIDVLELYDAFTYNTMVFLEDLGYCAKGEGGDFVSGGRIAPGGELAVNTNGGGLSYCHPGMYGLFLLIEAARQIQGVCDARQIDDVNLALAHGNGGVLSSQCTVILGSEATL
jgi:acetyl-CoA acetyltransferase